MLRAGVPSVIMPFLADQPWWARHLHHQKLGPAGLSRKTKKPSVIAASIAAARSYEGVTKLAGLKMATEDGLARAVEVIQDAEAGVHPLRPS
jgi:sterol 3beta-glucosyltransferase